MRRILVTGATGLVGFEVLDQLRATPGVEAIGTSRRGSNSVPGVVAWDLLGEECPAELLRSWDAIVHTAADVRWTMRPDEAWRANVLTVEALRPLVAPSTHLVHVSTAYAEGLGGGTTDLDNFRNAYEWSKAHSEVRARDLFERLSIVRPPLIAGRRGDGRAARFNGMYTILRGIVTSSVPVLTARADGLADIIPVDALGGLLVERALQDIGSGRIEVIAGGAEAPSVEAAVSALLDGLNGWRTEHGHEPLAVPRIISPESWNRFFRPFAREHLTARQNLIIDLLSNFEPYFELTTPLEPTHPVGSTVDCITASARYWAQKKARLAAMSPRPWRGADEPQDTVVTKGGST